MIMTSQQTVTREMDKRNACLAAMIMCSVLASGCRIPEPRGALPGPVVPQAYALNNGAAVRSEGAGGSSSETKSPVYDLNSPADGSQSPASDPHDSVGSSRNGVDETSANSGRHLNPIRLVSLVKSARLFGRNETDHSESGTRSSDESGSWNDGGPDNAGAAWEPGGAPARLPLPPPPVPPADSGNSDKEVYSLENSSQIPLNAFFDDPLLVGLINEALSGNQELRILAEEINIANNEAYARSGEYLPFVTLGGSAGLEKPSRFSRAGAVEEQLEVAPGRGFPEPLPDFLVATNVSWELDIWRKLRNAQDAATLRFLGTQEGRNYIVTRLVAEVAENYYELLALDNRLRTLQQTIEIQRQSLKVAQAKKEAGRGTELAVQRFQAEVRKNESEKLIIQQEIVEAENRINLLVGRYPQPVERRSVEYIDLNLAALSAGLPSQLLQNRADIREAERQVEAAGLDLKVARARFYPSLGLQAGVGLNAHNMRYLLSTPESLIYNAALDLVGPIINRRAIEADYRSANAAQLQSIYNYQRTVLTACIEVVNYMTKVENYRQSIEVKKQQLAALEASVDAANRLFQNARAEYVEVLLAQREMMEARMVLIETKQQQLSAIVNAYQALGGGGF